MRAPRLIIASVAPLVALAVGLASCGPKGLKVPELGPVPAMPEWPLDPPTPEKAALGEALYRDPRLSGSGRTSCDSCHIANTSVQDNLPLPTPDSSYPLDSPKVARHTPSLLNLVYAPFDRWNAGDDGAMSAAAVRGLELFRGEARCIGCHSGPFFSDFDFHNLSVSPPRADGSRADEGRFLVTHREEDRGKFLTPTLRAAWDTAPYFHDGSADRLLDVVAHFSSPEVRADPNHDALVDQPLSPDQMDDLVTFMKALRGAR